MLSIFVPPIISRLVIVIEGLHIRPIPRLRRRACLPRAGSCRVREYPAERRADGQNRGGGPDGRAPLGDTRRGWDRIILRRALIDSL